MANLLSGSGLEQDVGRVVKVGEEMNRNKRSPVHIPAGTIGHKNI